MQRKKVAFVAHCLLNQNAKVAEFARLPGVVSPVIQKLKQNNFIIEQLPCPELLAMGLTRWWTTREIYDNPGYRRHCRNLAKFTADLIEDYHKKGYEIIIVGLDGSPSSGVNYTGSSEPIWGGRPNATVEQYKIVPGRGIWIEELEKELNSRGIPFPKATGIPMDSPDFDMEKAIEDFDQFLKG
jgi:predicted secreted protein